MKKILACALALCGMLPSVWCEDAAPQNAANAKPAGSPPRVAVLDFSSVDTKGYSFLERPNLDLKITPSKSLNSEDRRSINSVMQGLIGAIDAWDTHTRNQKMDDWNLERLRTEWARWNDLYNTITKGPTRPMVIGADYLSSYLSAAKVECVEGDVIAEAMNTLPAQENFPVNALRRLGEASGVTHLVYGTVADLQTKTQKFSGYGVQTETKFYSLEVIIKVVDLRTQSVVFGQVYTAKIKETAPYNPGGFDDNIFQSLLTDCLKNAARDIAEYLATAPEPVIKPEPKPEPKPSAVNVQLTVTSVPGDNPPEVNVNTELKKTEPVAAAEPPKPAPETAAAPLPAEPETKPAEPAAEPEKIVDAAGAKLGWPRLPSTADKEKTDRPKAGSGEKSDAGSGSKSEADMDAALDQLL